MWTEKIVDKIMDCLMKDRQAAGTAEFWEENMFYRTDEIFSRVWADPEVQTEGEEDVKKIIEMTLAMIDADYIANNERTDWGVWENDKTGEVVSSYEKGIGWTLVASFCGVMDNVRDLDKKFQDEDMEFCQVWDEFMEYWGENAAADYAEKIYDYFCGEEE